MKILNATLMRIPHTTYTPANGKPGTLRFKSKGVCIAYIPDKIKNLEPHVVFDFGDYQVFLELDKFRDFAKGVLGKKIPTKVLKLVKDNAGSGQ